MPELKVPETGDVVVRRALDETASTVQCLVRRDLDLEGPLEGNERLRPSCSTLLRAPNSLRIEERIRKIYKIDGGSHFAGIQPIEGMLNLIPPCRRRISFDNQLTILKESNVPVGIQVVLDAVLAIVEVDR